MNTKNAYRSALLTAAWLLCNAGAWANDFVVSNTNDSGAGSLRDAITSANAIAGHHRILATSIYLSGTVQLSSCLPQISHEVDINLPTAFILDGSSIPRQYAGPFAWGNCFAILMFNPDDPSRAQVSTITGATLHGGPGGIYAYGRNVLTLTVNDTVAEYTFSSGIRIADTRLNLNHAIVQLNQSSRFAGGGVSASNSQIQVTESLIFGNSSRLNGGGIYLYNGSSATISKSSVISNSSSQSGGGIYISAYGATLPSTISIQNTTIADNAASDGGGLYFNEPNSPSTASLSLINDTVFNNGAATGSAISSPAGASAIKLISTALGDPSGTALCNIVGTPVGTTNVSTHSSCVFNGMGNQTVASLGTGWLEESGSHGFIIRPKPGSPLLDAGMQCLNEDQRGEIRTYSECDVGAVESNTLGAQRTLFLAIYNDPGISSRSLQQAGGYFTSSAMPMLDKQLRDSSYNRAWVTGDTAGPYFISDSGCDASNAVTTQKYILQQALMSANSSGIDLTRYNRFVIYNMGVTTVYDSNGLFHYKCFNFNPHGLTPGHISQYVGVSAANGQSIEGSQLWYQGSADPSITEPALIHEYQHTLGRTHIFQYICSRGRGDTFYRRTLYGAPDVLLSSRCRIAGPGGDEGMQTSIAPMGFGFLNHTDIFGKYEMGWLDPSNVATFTLRRSQPLSVSRTYTITPTEVADSGIKMVAIPLSNPLGDRAQARTLVLEYRQLLNSDQVHDPNKYLPPRGLFAYAVENSSVLSTFNNRVVSSLQYLLSPPPYGNPDTATASHNWPGLESDYQEAPLQYNPSAPVATTFIMQFQDSSGASAYAQISITPVYQDINGAQVTITEEPL